MKMQRTMIKQVSWLYYIIIGDDHVVDKAPWEEIDADWVMTDFELAMTGNAFQLMIDQIINSRVSDEKKEEIKRVITHAKIYARMSPDHKALLVMSLQQNTDDMIGMWGDGANDCKALKTADVGLSLSEAEASIAAPFTSKVPNISPIIMLLKEGRASLVTCFTVFKFMALYSMIEFTSVIILYSIASNLGNWEFLYIDLFLIIPLGFTMSMTGPYPELSKSMPIGHLISAPVLFSVISQIIIQGVFQTTVYFLLRAQSWFVALEVNGDKNIKCQENTTLFFMSITLYLLVVIVFSVGKPFRKSMFTNYWLMGCLIIFGIITYLMILVQPGFITSMMELVHVSFEWRVGIVAFSVGYLFVGYTIESILIWIYTEESAS
jgi:cation-transporting ATPase 13A2